MFKSYARIKCAHTRTKHTYQYACMRDSFEIQQMQQEDKIFEDCTETSLCESHCERQPRRHSTLNRPMRVQALVPANIGKKSRYSYTGSPLCQLALPESEDCPSRRASNQKVTEASSSHVMKGCEEMSTMLALSGKRHSAAYHRRLNGQICERSDESESLLTD